MRFTFYHQPDQMNCGSSCLHMISKLYDRSISLEKIQKLSETNRVGSSLADIASVSEKIGF
ncbi:cysteine peptidase family C39 domain-containing protein [Fluviicola taffensis]|uniref:cysteine peptidase family C39 domain-containing protein n=1 Tax=Fluviicola taffensis TaxID=191579 RepID=UPI0006934DAB